jgi:hypothetical protein
LDARNQYIKIKKYIKTQHFLKIIMEIKIEEFQGPLKIRKMSSRIQRILHLDELCFEFPWKFIHLRDALQTSKDKLLIASYGESIVADAVFYTQGMN